jgi:arylsulfatase
MMRARHALMKKKYQGASNGRGIPLTGLSNARSESLAIKDRMQRNVDALPFIVS